MIKWPDIKYGDPTPEGKAMDDSWNSCLAACIEAYTKWFKENECEMIDMQTGIRHMVIKIKTGESND